MLCVHQWQRTLSHVSHILSSLPSIPTLKQRACWEISRSGPRVGFGILAAPAFREHVAGKPKRTSSHGDLGVCWKWQRKQEVLTAKHSLFLVYAWARPVHFAYLSSIDPYRGEQSSHTNTYSSSANKQLLNLQQTELHFLSMPAANSSSRDADKERRPLKKHCSTSCKTLSTCTEYKLQRICWILILILTFFIEQ